MSSGLRRDELGREILDTGPQGSTEMTHNEVERMSRETADNQAEADNMGVGDTPRAEERCAEGTCDGPHGMQWSRASMKRVRYRGKQREMVNHSDILGDEPRLRDEDLEDLVDQPDVVEDRVPKTTTRISPKRPGRAEVDEHKVTHIPFRTWCDTCVASRGLVTPHKKTQAEG